MTHREEIWNKAEQRLYELYGDYPALRIKNRFLSEKKMLAHAAEYLDELAGICRESLETHNEKLVVKNTVSCSLAAYLLGASEINPLPPHWICPKCHSLMWADRSDCIFDMPGTRTCECGAEMHADGYGLEWELYLPYAKKHKEKKDGIFGNQYHDLFESILSTHFQKNLLGATQVCHLLRQATGVAPDEIDLNDREVKCRMLNEDFSCLPPKLAEFLKQAHTVVQPRNFYELLKLISFAHGTHTWKNNAQRLLSIGKCNLTDIPATRDEVFVALRDAMRERGVYDTGFALDVSDKVCRGYYREYGMDEYTASTLKKLGFADWFSEYLSRVHYIAPKALAVLELRTFLTLAWYRIYYKSLFLDFTKDFC